ncbi:hypothetical protein ScPMuIL_006996 [Solemya velum]
MGSAPIFMPLWAIVRTSTFLMPSIYRRCDDVLYSLYQRLILFFFFTCTRVEVYLHGNTDVSRKENIVFICNHQSTVDWTVANLLAVQNGSLGHIRYILKDGLKFLPIYGFYFRQHGGIYVKRDKKFDEAKTRKDVKEIKDRKTPVWLVIFPEGTRFNPTLQTVVERSKQFAEREGLQVLENVLTPRVKALQISLQELVGHVTAVYDVTIAYSNTKDPSGTRIASPGMPDFLMGSSSQLHLFLERCDIESIPQESRQLQEWLHNQFLKKDRLLTDFYAENKTTDLMGPGKRLDISYKETVPAFCFWAVCLAGILFTNKGQTFYWKSLLTSTLGGVFWMSFRS